VSQHLPGSDATCYAQIWRSKGSILGILRSRQQALRQLGDRESRDLGDKLVQTRRRLAQLILSPPRDRRSHRSQLQKLTEQKETLERQLAERSAPFRHPQEMERFTPADLVRKLPPRSVFIDMLSYVRSEQDPKIPGQRGNKRTLNYVALRLLAEEAMLAEPSDVATMPLPGATVTLFDASQPLRSANSDSHWTWLAFPAVNPTRLPAQTPMPAQEQAEEAERRMRDRLFAEPDG
jgi:hypothetical protein